MDCDTRLQSERGQRARSYRPGSTVGLHFVFAYSTLVLISENDESGKASTVG